MAVQLIRFRGVPDDEAEEIRTLLNEQSIDFYETPAGNWGISMPSLWLNDESQLARANALIDDYQQQRMLSARSAYQQQKQTGSHRTLIDSLLENPLRFMVYLTIVIAIIYFSIKPFIAIGQ